MVAKALGVSRGVVDKLILIECELPEDIKRILRHCKYTQIYELLRIKNDHEALHRQAKWVADEDPSPREVRSRVDGVLGVRRGGASGEEEDERGGKYDTCPVCGKSVKKIVAEKRYFHTKCYKAFDRFRDEIKKMEEGG